MKNYLNLVREELTTIKYIRSKFPDGQQGIEILSIIPIEDCTVISRLNNFSDLEVIICAVKALRNIGCKNVNLLCPYLIGARSDRKFSIGGINYISQVIAPILNSLSLDSISVVDIHSNVPEACINNLWSISNREFIKWVISQIDNFVIVSPDEGAKKKVYSLAKEIEYNNEIVTCSKNRDIPTGKIIETVVPKEDFGGKNCLIIDDICDGGATFNEITKVLKQKNVGKLYLAITHGIFSKGIENLPDFETIFVTNSYQDFVENSKLRVYKVI